MRTDEMTDRDHLVRFPILDLREELETNFVAKGRHNEYIKFFEEYLNDKQYYCLSPYNPMRPKNAHYLLGRSSRTYIAGGVSNYFVATHVEIEGRETKAIVQKIYPRTCREFYEQEKYYVVYLSKKDIDQYLLFNQNKG